MLRWRLILGGLLVATFCALAWIDHAVSPRGLVLLPVACLLGMFATAELLQMFRDAPARPRAAETHAAVIVVIVLAGAGSLVPVSGARGTIAPFAWLATGLILGLLLALVGAMRGFRKSMDSDSTGATTARLALTLLAVLYIGGLVGCLVVLRSFEHVGDERDWGLLALASTIAVVKAGDIGAYTVGRLFGRNKLAPTLSPGKTWEGAAGGLVCSCGVAWLLLRTAPASLGWPIPPATAAAVISILAFGVAVGCAGVLGDLAESMLKRDAGVKDSSRWMPGFGGVLDLLDSLLVGAPVAALFWFAGWVGPG